MRITLFCIWVWISSLVSAGNYHNDSYNFDIEFPPEWEMYNPDQVSPGAVMVGQSKTDGTLVKINVSQSGKNVYSYKVAIESLLSDYARRNIEVMNVSKQPASNLLRNSFSLTLRLPDGYYQRNYYAVRAKTVFEIIFYKKTNNFEKEDQIIKTLDIHPTFRGNLYRLRDNFGVLWGSITLFLFAILGSFTRKYQDRYEILQQQLFQLIVCIALSVVGLLTVLYTLRDDLLLAGFVCMILLGIWISVYLRNNTLIGFFNGVFGP